MKIEDYSVRPDKQQIVFSIVTPDGKVGELEGMLEEVSAPGPWQVDWSGADLEVKFLPPAGVGKATSLPVVQEIGEALARLAREVKE